jgi:hypothetical protein
VRKNKQDSKWAQWGSEGARARWQHDIQWHREWVTAEPPQGWRSTLGHALMRAVFLRRCQPKDWEWTEDARAEVRKILAGSGVSVDMLLSLTSYTPWSDLKPPIARNWKRSYIARYLEAPRKWSMKLMEKQKTSVMANRILRRRQALLSIVVERSSRVTIREAQQLLKQAGFEASYFTVRADLQRVLEMLPRR